MEHVASSHPFLAPIDDSSAAPAGEATPTPPTEGNEIMPSHSTTHTAAVVGSTGIVGRAISAKLAEPGGWRVVGVTRSGGSGPASGQVGPASVSPGRICRPPSPPAII